MDALAQKRKLNDPERDAGSSQTAVGKYIISATPVVCSSKNDTKENNAVATEAKPVIISRTINIPSLQLVSLVPMNKALSTSKSVSPTSGSADGQPQRKFRYASLNANSLKRPPIRPEFSVTSSVATQTMPSFLREKSPGNKPQQQQQQQLNAVKTDMYAICAWCGNLNKSFTKCDRCSRALDHDSRIFSPSQGASTTLRAMSKPIQQVSSPATIVIPQGTIVLTPQEGPAALLGTPTVIKAGQFYTSQVSVQSTARVIPQTPNGASKVWVMGKQPTPVKKYRGKKKAEPECLTISSDEDEGLSSSNSFQGQTPEKAAVVSTPKDAGPETDSNSVCRKDDSGTSGAVWPQPESSNDSPEEEAINIKCRSIRIGSYKVQAYEPQTLMVTVTANEIRFTISCIDAVRMVNLSIHKDDIPSVLAHFGKVLPVLFVYTTPSCAVSIRTKLNMTSKEKPYFDPCNSDESMKRITILPVSLNDQHKTFLSHKFQLTEIKQTVANEILIKSTPVHQNSVYVGINVHRVETRAQVVITQTQAKVTKEVVKLVTYPPPPQTGGIEINSEDLECLNEGEFLNDVIIDFYLKYLINEKLSPTDRQQTHIFSSFFFPRLTTKNTDEEATINIIRRRHARVKTWTRHVDIFEKDYIVVPINQNSHWFLAVICFPGMVASGDATKVSVDSAKMQDGAPEVEEECEPSPSQCSPEEGAAPEPMETDDMESPLPPVAPPCPMTVPLDDTEKASPQPETNNPPESRDKGPCILIFDSLPGNQRWKVVQTLREYLTIEFETKKKETRIFDRNTMRGVNVTLLPRQENYTDCGIYLLQYVESFFESPLKKFSSPLPSLLDWFPDSKITQKRQELKELILSLQKQQQETNANRDSGSQKSTTPQEKTV